MADTARPLGSCGRLHQSPASLGSADDDASLHVGYRHLLSSTADIVINGVAEAPWLPGVLAVFAILGVFAGILLRVRAFLYLGASFLAVAFFAIIWYAAVEQKRTYIWWIAGIATGVAIIAFFGLFEKRRDEVLALVERLEEWQA